MKILLTGHKGFIGSHMLTALEADGHDVSTYEWGELLPSIMEQDWVIHVGANSSTVERDVDLVLRQNYDFTRQLFNACKTYGVNLQYSSSASVYGLVSTFEEDAPPDPRNPYAWSKYLIERYHTQHQGGNTVQGFRYFNVYGPEGEAHKGDQASPYYKFTNQAQTTGKIKLFKGSDQFQRDFIHVSKIVDMHLQFLNIKASGIWNMGTGRTKSFQEVAKEVADMYNADIEYIDMPQVLKGNYQAYTCADVTKLNSTLEAWQK
jgi:ADP-L-glycero-D-manno-heptose 6-epimerase